MNKKGQIPRLYWEIAITIVSLIALCTLWNFFLNRHITLSDQGLSTIGLALTTSIGVLTAIVVSFVLVVWQTSRRDRSESFLRWRNALHQLCEFYDANLEKFMDVSKEVAVLTQEASAAASIAPMDFSRCKELVSVIFDKITEDAEQVQNIQNPSDEQIEKARVRKYMSDYLVMLTHANFDHNITHNLYKGLLDLRGLLYRQLSLLIACIIIVTIAATTTSAGISDVFNTPLALTLVAWALYLLIHLGIEVKRFTRLEEEFSRREKEYPSTEVQK